MRCTDVQIGLVWLARRRHGALRAYLRDQRMLAPFIFSLLGDMLPRERWGEATFLDPSSDGAAISLTAKAQGFWLVATMWPSARPWHGQ